MKKTIFKSYLLKVGAPLVALAPIAVVVACHKTGKVELVEVDARVENLANISTSGDTRNVTFEISKELEYVNSENVLDPSGTTKAFEVLIKAAVKVGSTSLPINSSYMPAELLSNYLSGKLFWKNNVLTMKKGNADTSVQKEYGGLFGFNTANINAVNSESKPGEWAIELKAKYQPLGAFTSSKSELAKEVAIDTTSLKTYVTIDTSFLNDAATIATWTSKFAYQPTSSNENVRWTSSDIKVSDLPASLTKYVADLKFVETDPTTSVFKTLTSIPTSFDADPLKRNLLVGLVPNSNYVLSKKTIDLTAIARVRDISINVDSQPGFAAVDLSKIAFRTDGGTLLIDESLVTAPIGTVIKYQLGSGGEYLTADLFPAYIKNQLTATFSDVNVHLETKDKDKYKLVDDKKTKPDVSAVQGFANTSAFFTSLSSLKVDTATSTPSAIVWLGTPTLPTALGTATARLEYLAGDYATEALARTATEWSTSLPRQTRATWRDFNLWARLVPKSGYVLSATYVNLSTTSLLNKVIPDTNISDLLAISNTLTADTAVSVHNNVRWNKSVTIPVSLASAIASVEFASGNYTAANVLTSATWTSVLPTTIDFDSTKRTLWMRITPQTGFKFEQSLYDLTITSKVRDVLSLIDAEPTFKDVNLALITIFGAVESAVITEPSSVPEGAKIVYSLTSSGPLSKADFISYLATNSGTLTGDALTKIQVALDVRDPKKYKITNTKSATPITTDLKIVASTLPANLLTLLTSIKANVNTSTHQSLKWDGVPTVATLPASVASLSYLSDETSTTKDIASAVIAGWSTTLPLTASADHAKRNLWVKITPAAGYSFADPYLSLTSSSDIRLVRTYLDVSQINLAQISISGDYNALVQNNNGVIIPNGAVMTFKFKTSGYNTFQNLQTQIQAATRLTATDIDTIRVHLQRSSGLYELSGDAEAKPNVSGIRTALSTPSAFTNMVNAIRVTSASTHDALSFTPVSWTPPATISSVSYALGNYATAEVASGSSVVWVDSLSQLTSTAFQHNTRYLWARINPASGANFEQRLFDISAISGIRGVKSKVDALPSYAQADLSRIVLTGPYTNITVNTSSVTAPEGAQLVYQFNGGSWVSESQVKSQISAYSPISTSLINTIKVQLAALNDTFVVSSPRTATPNLSGITISVAIPSEVTNYLQNISANLTTSTHNAVVWPTLGTLPTTLQSVSFASGNYATKESVAALDSSAWQTSLPTVVEYRHSDRYLWAKLTPASGYQFSEVYYEITGTSGIRSVKTRIDSSIGYNLINLANITFTGSYNNLTISTSSITIPDGAKLVYQYNGGSWVTDAQLKTQISSLSTITSAQLNTIKVKFDVLNDTYVISDPRIATPNVSGVSIPLTTLPVDVVSYMATIKPNLETSRNTSVVWPTLGTLPSTLQSISYVSGNFPSRASVVSLAATEWKAELPTAVDYTHSNRHLWAKLTPTSGYQFSDVYYYMTSTSEIQKVKTVIDSAFGYTNNYLNAVTISGIYNAVTINLDGITTPRGADLVYQINGGSWVSEAAFKSLLASYTSITPEIVATIKMKFLAQSSLYVIQNNRESSPDVSAITIPIDSSVINGYLSQVKVNLATSTSGALQWDPLPTSIPSQLNSITYILGNYLTKADASVILAVLWNASLPSTANYASDKRYLWARISVKTGYTYSENVVDISNSSGIRSVKTLVDSSQNYSLLNMAGIKISGPYRNLSFDTSAIIIPTGAVLRYQFNNGDWMDEDEFRRLISALTIVTPGILASIKVKLAPENDQYTITNPLISSPDVSGITLS